MSIIARLVSLLALTATGSLSFAQKQQPTLNHVALYVSDLKKSTTFYHDIVQLDTVPEPFHDGLHTWFRIGPLSHLHLIGGPAPAMIHDKHNHLCFTVASLTDFIAHLDKNNLN